MNKTQTKALARLEKSSDKVFQDVTQMAFLNTDFRDFQGIPAVDENLDNAILMFTYTKLIY
ncbi:MAG: hypothetical protein HOJ48_00960 [Desulfobacula sp.]|nr:hypothetical protein [Desulfobacula sp.]